MSIKQIINTIYYSQIYTKIFHTLASELKNELQDCSTVLDLGCGPSSPLQFCRNIKFSVGVEPFTPYLQKSKTRRIHTRYINAKVEDLDFKEKSFDAVIMLEVLEHIDQKKGREIIKKIEKWAKKKVIISAPNGFLAQPAVDNNQLQKHLSGWSTKMIGALGYQVVGLEGLKCLRKDPLPNDLGNILATVRFEPKFFWFIIVNLSQLIVYHWPIKAFAWLGVKRFYSFAEY